MPARFRVPAKVVLCIVVAVLLAAFAFSPLGALPALRQGSLIVRTGPYLWTYSILDFSLVAGLAAAAVFAAMVILSPWPIQRQSVAGKVLASFAVAPFAYALIANILGQPSFDMFPLAVAACIAGAFGFRGTLFSSLSRRGGEIIECVRLRPGVVFAGIVCLSAVIWASVVHDWCPIIGDAQSQLLQAHLMLDGLWRMDVSDQLASVLVFPNAVRTGGMCSYYPPGHILALLPIVAAGLSPNVLNVLAGTACAALTIRLAWRLAGRSTAVWTGFIFAFSPFFGLMSGSAMNHSTAALAFVITAFCWLRAYPVPPNSWWALAGGMALGWACSIRPYTATAQGAVWGIAWLYLMVQQPRWRKSLMRFAMAAAAGAAVPLSLFLWYNAHTTGSPFLMGYTKADPQMHAVGFISSGEYRYGPWNALENQVAGFLSMNSLMFGCAMGSWTIIAAWLWHTRLRRWEVLCLGLIMAQIGAYSLYHYHDLIIGPRFWFEVMPFFLLLGGTGLASVSRRMGHWRDALVALVILGGLSGWAASLTEWRYAYMAAIARDHAVSDFVRKHRPFSRPAVIVIPADWNDGVAPYVSYGAGRTPLLFVKGVDETRARALPELQGYEWLNMSDGQSSSTRQR